MKNIQIKRINWIDIAKAFGIIIVLAYHACPEGYIKNFLWQMHMPFFAFLSGIVYSKKYSSDIYMLLLFVKKRIETIYIPFVSYSLVFLVFHNFFYKINFIGPINGNQILSGGVHKTGYFNSYLGRWRIINWCFVVFDSTARTGNCICYSTFSF